MTQALTTRWSSTGTKHIYLRNLNADHPGPTLCGNWNPPRSYGPGGSKSCGSCRSVLEAALRTLDES